MVSGLFKPQHPPNTWGWGLAGSRSGNRLRVTAVTWEPLRACEHKFQGQLGTLSYVFLFLPLLIF